MLFNVNYARASTLDVYTDCQVAIHKAAMCLLDWLNVFDRILTLIGWDTKLEESYFFMTIKNLLIKLAGSPVKDGN